MFYHYDAFVFELLSCFDLILQWVNIKLGLNQRDDRISWGKQQNSYMAKVKVANSDVFDVIDGGFTAWWFADLQESRNY